MQKYTFFGFGGSYNFGRGSKQGLLWQMIAKLFERTYIEKLKGKRRGGGTFDKYIDMSFVACPIDQESMK